MGFSKGPAKDKNLGRLLTYINSGGKRTTESPSANTDSNLRAGNDRKIMPYHSLLTPSRGVLFTAYALPSFEGQDPVIKGGAFGLGYLGFVKLKSIFWQGDLTLDSESPWRFIVVDGPFKGATSKRDLYWTVPFRQLRNGEDYGPCKVCPSDYAIMRDAVLGLGPKPSFSHHKTTIYDYEHMIGLPRSVLSANLNREM